MNSSVFNINYDVSKSADFAVLDTRDAIEYLKNSYHSWNGQHMTSLMMLDQNLVAQKPAMVEIGHNAFACKPIDLILAFNRTGFLPHYYLAHFVSHKSFLDKNSYVEFENIKKTVVNLNKATGMPKLCDQILFVGNEITVLRE